MDSDFDEEKRTLPYRVSAARRTRRMPMQYKIFFTWFLCMTLAVFWMISSHGSKPAVDTMLVLGAMLGMIMLFDMIRDAYYSNLSRLWPTTLFTVVNTNIVRGINDNDNVYSVAFELEYEVFGQKYYKDNSEFRGNRHNTPDEAKAYLVTLQSGEMGRMIYYNRDNPEQAYLKPGIKIQHFVTGGIGLAIAVVCVLTITGDIVWK